MGLLGDGETKGDQKGIFGNKKNIPALFWEFAVDKLSF